MECDAGSLLFTIIIRCIDSAKFSGRRASFFFAVRNFCTSLLRSEAEQYVKESIKEQMKTETGSLSLSSPASPYNAGAILRDYAAGWLHIC